MDAEQVRDSILAVSGQLRQKVYGAPIALCTLPDGSYSVDPSGRVDDKIEYVTRFYPPPCEKSRAWDGEDDSRDPNRRSIYVQNRRTYVVGFMGAFDAPVMETNASVRFSTAAPRQALTMLHNPLVLKAAERLTERAKQAGTDPIAQIRRAIELTYSRPASEAEVSFAFQEIQKQKDPELGMRLFSQALLGSSEFIYID